MSRQEEAIKKLKKDREVLSWYRMGKNYNIPAHHLKLIEAGVVENVSEKLLGRILESKSDRIQWHREEIKRLQSEGGV